MLPPGFAYLPLFHYYHDDDADMPQVPRTCPATGQPTSKDYVYILNGHFVDTTGRTLLLRGVNLSGSSKAPVGQPSHVLDDFWASAQAGGHSFLGRPFNLDDGSADAHLNRLRGWGFNVLRYPVTWEALEHEGPGRYDYDFMDYTIRVLYKCKEYGFKVYLDPHQDSWSRFSGGSGAPYWTLPACGIDPQAFTATQAAIVHCEYPSTSSDIPDPAALPAMVWSTNYSRLASQTLFALFFAGKTFAPKCILDGVHIQDYLQSHFTQAFGVLADRIRDAGGLLDDVVIGWDSMNEPAEGFIGYKDLSMYPTTQGSALKKGTMPTPLQSLKLGMGVAQTLDNYTFGAFGSQRSGTVTVDPKGVRIWADPSTEPNGVHPKWGWKRSSDWTLGTCVWALHEVWDIDTGSLLRPHYFSYYPSPSPSSAADPDPDPVPVHFLKDFFLPHLTDYVTRIRAAHPSAIAFVQAPVFAIPPAIPESLLQGRGCHSTHYYDGLTLVTRHWHLFNADAVGVIRGKYSNPIFAGRFGESAIRASIQSQLGVLKSDGVQLGVDAPGPRQYPTMIGEIGTPIDMDDKKAYDPTRKGYGDYSTQERALDASLNAADGPNALSYTVWTYCPDNSHMWGDGWNNEDLSLWSEDDVQEAGHYAGAAGSLASARMSSASLVTLPVPSSPYASATSSYTSKSGPLPELLRFLRDGARAIRAFCRPYPVKVVGTPVDIQFDIGKASLKVKVRVTPADAPQRVTAIEGKSEGLESALPTEIFIPLVHFASEACVEQSVVVRKYEQQAESEDDEGDVEVVKGGCGWGSTDTLSLTSEETIQTDGYAVRVQVSEGRVEMDEGEQMLRWFYSLPVSGEKEVSIKVSRVGGAIDWARAGMAGGVRSGKPGVVEWVERLCGGCVIV
ncbi:glycoside hydrolase family 5 protein [Lanmaoa asiatica]|nr:glycoside hydrolase family 5 protein [Lanmaoa asiatica]